MPCSTSNDARRQLASFPLIGGGEEFGQAEREAGKQRRLIHFGGGDRARRQHTVVVTDYRFADLALRQSSSRGMASRSAGTEAIESRSRLGS